MKIKKNGEVIRLTESDIKKIVKRVLTEQIEEFDAPQDMGYTLDESGHRVVVTSNNGFDAIEDKVIVEIITGTDTVNTIPNLMEFTNLFVINCGDCAPLVDIDVDSILNNKNLMRVIFNYVDSPMMNSKVNELMNSEAVNSGFKQIQANRVENEIV